MDYRNVTIAQGSKGLRDNNPLNVNSDHWQGEINPVPGSEAIFEDDIYGLRAAALNLYDYYYLHQLTTVSDIVARWAPVSDGNDPVTYANNVAAQLGIDPGDQITMDGTTLFNLMRAMMVQELGSNYAAMVSDDDVTAGINATEIETLLIAGGSALLIGAIIFFIILINSK